MSSKSYIVRFKPETSDEEVAKVKKNLVDSGAEIEHEYTLIKGFSVKLPDTEVSILSTNPFIEDVEKDQEVKAF
ncbi:hypothetical protein V1511DRAFT_503305 [Dipodascopsis uninucleata]